MSLTDTVAAAAFDAVRTNLGAAQCNVKPLNRDASVGLMVDLSEAKRVSMYGADPNYMGRVWVKTSELALAINSQDVIQIDTGLGYKRYRARQVDELAGLTRVELESEFTEA